MLARKAMLVVVNDIIGTLLGYIALYLILREYGRFEYGILAFGLAFIGLYEVLANLGFNKANVKRVSEGKDLGTCVGTFLAIKLVLLLAFNAAVLLSLFAWTDVMGHGFETRRHESVILVLLLYVNLEAFAEVFLTTFNGRLEIAKSQISRIAGNVIRLCGMIYVTTIATKKDAAELLAWTYVLGASVELGGALWLYRGMPISRPSREMVRSYARFAIPAIVMTSTSVIIINTDKVMVQAFWSASDVGIYASAQRVIMVIGFLANAISAVLMPSISRLHVKGKHRRILELVDQTEHYILLVSLPLAAFMLVVPHRIINIVLYNQSSPVVLQILALWVVVYVFNTPYRSLIQGYDRPGILAKLGVLEASVDTVLNLIFIPATFMGVRLLGMKAEGAAITTLMTDIFIFILIRHYGHRLAGARTDRRHLLLLPAAVAFAATAYALDSLQPALRWYHLVLYFLVSLAVYALVLVATRQLSHTDIRFILDAANPFGMARYISGEMRGKGGRGRRHRAGKGAEGDAGRERARQGGERRRRE